MSQSFFDHPILNSPYEPPSRYHALDGDGQPLDVPPILGRRPCDFVTPVPKPNRRSTKGAQSTMVFEDQSGLTDAEQEYNPKPIINEIRNHVASWRALPSDRDWGSHRQRPNFSTTGVAPTWKDFAPSSVRLRQSRPSSG